MLGHVKPLSIKVVSIPVSDQDRARRFYVDRLGFDLVSDRPYGEGLRWLEVRPHGSTTSFTLVTWFDSMPAGSLQGTVFETSDVHSAHKELLDRGVEFEHEPRAESWGTYTTFADPDGNSFLLSQAPRT